MGGLRELAALSQLPYSESLIRRLSFGPSTQ